MTIVCLKLLLNCIHSFRYICVQIWLFLLINCTFCVFAILGSGRLHSRPLHTWGWCLHRPARALKAGRRDGGTSCWFVPLLLCPRRRPSLCWPLEGALSCWRRHPCDAPRIREFFGNVCGVPWHHTPCGGSDHSGWWVLPFQNAGETAWRMPILGDPLPIAREGLLERGGCNIGLRTYPITHRHIRIMLI